MVVLNEREYAEELLQKDVTCRTAGHALHYIAKLYFSQGYSKEEVKKKLDDFLVAHMFGYNRVLDENFIVQAIASAKGKQLVELDGVSVTMAVNNKCNYWITEDTRDIFRMAGVSVNVDKQNEMIRELRNLGFIGFASLKKIDNLNIHVLIADEEPPIAVTVSNFETAGIQWNQFCGKPYIRCECCGRTVARTGRRQKYCRKCAKSINIEKTSQNRKMFDL